MNKETGGPAFPSTFHNGWGEPEKGMTLRDYFAAKAMQEMLQKYSQLDDISRSAYKIADAMLRAREAE